MDAHMTGPDPLAAAASELLRRRIAESVATKQELLADEAALAALSEAGLALVASLEQGGTVFFCGNGGSATDCEHLSAELLGRFYRDRRALASVNLSSNTAAMTAIANDYAYEEVYARQLRGLAKPGDVLVGLSTSGGSRNVIAAVEAARGIGVVTIGFTSRAGGKLAAAVDICFRAPSDDTPRVQECHMVAGHTLCEYVEDRMCPQA